MFTYSQARNENVEVADEVSVEKYQIISPLLLV